ncbi:MAG: ABC transporter permease [Actinobacteria bacterium]|nr:ABC transporter permease [Actinomycetota bacterium]
MRQVLREVRRAPSRIVVSVFALALAIGAIGVFAIPTVASSSLRDAAERDNLAEVVIGTSDTGDMNVETLLDSLDNVQAVDTQIETEVSLDAGAPGGALLKVIGFDGQTQQIDLVHAEDGRLPEGRDEVLVSNGVAPIGTTVAVTGQDGETTDLTVVGIGGTSFWSATSAAFTTLETARDLAGLEGVNRIVISADDVGKDELRATADSARDLLAQEDVAMTFLPITIANNEHPVEADIEQVSSLIGILGIVAGIVALVLLGSTTNTLITERTREVAVMRALGARSRPLRRRLRRLAVGIAIAAVVIGVPLGILISNVIARMVLQEFVGVTPDIAVSLPVIAGSVLFALVGARLVAARAARRVTKIPLATALRDRDGSPFGRRFTERLASRVRLGGLLDRTAFRNGVHRRSRSMAIVAQITAAVAALLIIASLATTINDFNAASVEPFNWVSRTEVAGPGLDIDADVADSDPRSEVSIDAIGEFDGWQVDVRGVEDDTLMIDRHLDEGSWFVQSKEAVVSTGFAERVGVNIVYSLDEQPAVELAGLTETIVIDSFQDDGGRQAILMIFGAIGFVVVSVAGLAVASGLAVNVYERRHEFAALQAVGGRKRHVFRVVSAELIPMAVLGIGFGLIAGYFGGKAIMGSFEASNAVEIGYTFAAGVIPAAAAVVIVGSLVLGGLMVRRVTRQPAALTLRSAA